VKKNLTKTNTKKRAMIKALESTLGIVSTACKKVGVSRITHYEWYKTDDEYKAGVDSVADIALDFAESQLHKQISGGNPTSTIFYLKTKGKKRGFVEKTEIEHTGDLNTTVTLFTLPDNERDE
jgi:hypothetical protein